MQASPADAVQGGFAFDVIGSALRVRQGVLHHVPLNGTVAATSVGIIGDEVMLDLCYEEDFRAQVDFNVVMTESGEFVEVQGTGEEKPFSRASLDEMLATAESGIMRLTQIQKDVVAALGS